jgi:Ca2+-binding EF-hand superfamily protein
MRFIVVITLVVLTTSGCIGMAARAVAQPSKLDLSKLLERADANGDGIITKAEFGDARAKMFERLDRNHDGYLTKDDKPRFSLRQSGQGNRLQEMLLMLDKDGDGRISREEFVNSPSLLFDRADTNHDGQVDSTELAAFRAAMAARGAQ